MLEVRGIHKSFSLPGSARIEVLKEVGFSMEAGQTRAIIGQSGSGKTTLLSLIAGLDFPDQGEVVLNGQNLSSMAEDRLARFRAGNIGIIFQQFHLMPHLTAQENISLPLEILKAGNIRERTLDMLEKTGLTKRKNHLPGQLSGGECQRVAIARALVTNPSLVLADEPTGNLDTRTGEIIADLMFDLAKQEGKSLVLVTHNGELAGRCSRVLHLDKGILS
ncbi:ABC transporter ATP-binding protein [Desulfospira joergensenii]|uniref:ABC transporter ATP-binding protein n=1 Tax=Desulfospira joergensenii TaxID=53329 RepID=UPI0003B57161|nr:ABC transporter ATP-binding protein [Desulfospira joergensenii]